jgi:hypothetical protein
VFGHTSGGDQSAYSRAHMNSRNQSLSFVLSSSYLVPQAYCEPPANSHTQEILKEYVIHKISAALPSLSNSERAILGSGATPVLVAQYTSLLRH